MKNTIKRLMQNFVVDTAVKANGAASQWLFCQPKEPECMRDFAQRSSKVKR